MKHVSEGRIDAAVAALRAGEVVAVPTDTVYGLAVDPSVAGATARLFEVKGRPRQVELPVLVAGIDQARSLAAEPLPKAAARLMERLWPGGLTIVVARRPQLDIDLGADDATVGLRWPDHPIPVELCRAVGPLATTSANVHGQASLVTATGVVEVFGEAVAVVLGAGPCPGTPSTVVDCTGAEPRLLRAGAVSGPEIERALG